MALPPRQVLLLGVFGVGRLTGNRQGMDVGGNPRLRQGLNPSNQRLADGEG